jgi:tetratricopeptide (TPR) repeat protein
VRYHILVLFSASILTGCLGQRLRDVTPAEIPDLEARLQREPDNAALRSRYAAALFAADRCDQAAAEARRAEAVRPADAVAAMVIGQCAEKSQRYQDALAEYRTFLAQHPDVRGSAAIRAREQLALRVYSTQRARLALQNEAQLSAQAADPGTVAVLPLTIAGDTSYQALSRGLAQMITSDLALIQRFRLLERLQLATLLDEMRLGQTARADPNTAARVGRLMQAGRMVQGTATIPGQGDTRLEASVVQASGEVSAPGAATGRFRDLLKMEKALVVELSARLGYQLSEAEQRRVLENGTQNLVAFLAYSRGLAAEDAGDFSRAAAYFSEAVQTDPGFQAAKEQYQAASVSSQVQEASSGQITTVVNTPPPPEPLPQPVIQAMTYAQADVGGLKAEQVTAPGPAQGTGTSAADPPKTVTIKGTPSTSTGTIRIIFRLP